MILINIFLVHFENPVERKSWFIAVFLFLGSWLGTHWICSADQSQTSSFTKLIVTSILFPAYCFSDPYVISANTTTLLDILPPTQPFTWSTLIYRPKVLVIHHSALCFQQLHHFSLIYWFFNSTSRLMTTTHTPIPATPSYARPFLLLFNKYCAYFTLLFLPKCDSPQRATSLILIQHLRISVRYYLATVTQHNWH